MNDRLKLLRRTLGLTQAEFAECIGSVQNTITGYESGRRNPSNPVISSICREFNVNEEWLRTGAGEMFLAAPSSELDALARAYDYTHRDYVIVEKFSKLNRRERDVILNFLVDVAAGCADVIADTPAFPSSGSAELDIDAEVEAYRRALELQKKAEDGSSVSNGSGGIVAGGSKKEA